MSVTIRQGNVRKIIVIQKLYLKNDRITKIIFFLINITSPMRGERPLQTGRARYNKDCVCMILITIFGEEYIYRIYYNATVTVSSKLFCELYGVQVPIYYYFISNFEKIYLKTRNMELFGINK